VDIINRTFIAIRPSPEIISTIDNSLLQLKRKPGILDMRWNQPSEYLINLVTLGELSPATISRIIEPVGSTLANLKQFEIEMTKFGGLPNLIQPRFAVLQLGGVGANVLAQVANALESVTKPLCPPRETKPFQPQIVMGRIKTESEQLRVALGRALKTPEHPPFGTWHVSQIEILISQASTQGMAYKAIHTFDLVP
jgi:2'-5' RNA ligase